MTGVCGLAEGQGSPHVGYAVPLPRFAKLPEDRRRSILDAARIEFAAQGFADASYNRIIAATGISKGAMYYYFADKADLYTAVLEDVLDGIEAVALEAGPLPTTCPDGFWTALKERALDLAMAVEADSELAALGHRLYSSGVGVQHITVRVSRWICSLLAKGRECDAVRVDMSMEVLAHATTGLMMGLDRYMASNAATLSDAEKLEASTHALQLCEDLLRVPSA